VVFCVYVFAMADNSVFPDPEPAPRPRASEMTPPMVGGGVLAPLFIRYATNARPTTAAVTIGPIPRGRNTPPPPRPPVSGPVRTSPHSTRTRGLIAASGSLRTLSDNAPPPLLARPRRCRGRM
jgi:hypothetical protein